MRRTHALRAVLLIGSLAFCLAVSEAGLRLVSPIDPFGSRLALRPHISIELTVDLGGVSPHGRHSTNAWGLRGDEPPPPGAGSYTIITISAGARRSASTSTTTRRGRTSCN